MLPKWALKDESKSARQKGRNSAQLARTVSQKEIQYEWMVNWGWWEGGYGKMRQELMRPDDKGPCNHIKESGFYEGKREVGNQRFEAGSSMIKFGCEFSVQ